MKMRFFGLLLLLAALSVGPSRLVAQEEAPPSEEAPAAPAETEKPTEDSKPAESGEGDAPAEQPAEESNEPAKPEEAAPGSDEPAEDAEVQEAIKEADPAVEPTQEEAAAAADEEVIVEETAVEETVPDTTAPAAEGSLGEPLDLDTLPTAEGLDVPNPDDLLPEDVYTPGEDDELAPPPPAMTESKIDRDRRLAVRYQEVKLQALKDAAIREMREKADVARTDEEKRQALREYYRMLFAKIVSIDPELEDKCRLLETAYMRRVSQFRVMPTIPLQPPPTPEPLPGRAESGGQRSEG